jgi:hypothetical protein
MAFSRENGVDVTATPPRAHPDNALLPAARSIEAAAAFWSRGEV